jgi:putative transposase
MARKPRIHFPGAVYHVMIRGNSGLPVFFGDTDRSRFYLILQETIERFDYRLHAFCCMENHIHMAIQVGDIPLSRIMQNLSVRYTAWINHSRQRAGHLFQGRYKAILVDTDSYLLQLVRYIHLNPVRAGIVTNPEDYRGSGHLAYLGIETLPWLTTSFVLSLLSKDMSGLKYREFIAEGTTEDQRQSLHSGNCDGRFLGSENFVRGILRKACEPEQRQVSLQDIIREVCSDYGIPASQLMVRGKVRPHSEARAVAALLVRESENLSLAALGKVLNRDSTAMSQAAQRLACHIKEDSALMARLSRIKTALAGP